MTTIYLDNNATTAVSRPVFRSMATVLRRHHGNPSAIHAAGRTAASILQNAREDVASAIHAQPSEIIFTGSATEANNQVLETLSDFHSPRRNRILSTPIEHPSIMQHLSHLADRGVEIAAIPVDDRGRVIIERLKEQIDENTFLICCMLANNEIGTIQDVRAVVDVARLHDLHVHCDCVQALGKIPVDVQELGVDFASFSAHKLYGPKGVGALFVRSGAPIAPLLHGGNQEAGLRAGTEGVHNIAGMGAACRAVPELLARAHRVASRRDFVLEELRRLEPKLVINSPSEHCLPNTLNLTFPGVQNAVLLAVLDMHGIAVSAGSACHAAEPTPSHVLTAIGLSGEQANETVRISLSHRTTSRDLRYAIRVFRDFFEGRTPAIPFLRPSQIDEAFLFDENNYLLDVRFEVERKLMRGLPNTHDTSVVSFRRTLHHIPKEKRVVVVCSTGFDATAIAYSLHKLGYPRVAILLGGVVAWQIQQPKLYRQFAGTNCEKLSPRGRGNPVG